MSLRDWLIVIGVVIVIGILADGIRRARKNRRDSLALDQSLTEHMSDELPARAKTQELNPELPNGGARVVRQEPVFADNDTGWDQRTEPGFDDSGLADDPAASSVASADTDLAQDDPISDHAQDVDRFVKPVAKPAAFEPEVADEPAVTVAQPEKEQPRQEPVSDSESLAEDVPMLVPELDERRAASEQKARPSFGFKRKDAEAEASALAQKTQQPAPQRPQSVQQKAEQAAVSVEDDVEVESLAARPPAEDVLVINLIAENGELFSGAQLLQVLLACDMKFGEMKIFHRFEHTGGRGKVMFSMASGVEPGCFDLEQMDQLQTPAISFFMGLPGPSKPMQAFEQMLKTVEYLQSTLGGRLEDEHHSVMRKQTLEHCRQRVAEFERRQLTQQRSAR